MEHSLHHVTQLVNQAIEGENPIVVIKIGTSSLVRSEASTLNLLAFAGLAEEVRNLRAAGYQVIVVSSGAVGVGCQRLGLEKKPTELAKKQALAALGQVHMMRFYEDLFGEVGIKVAQVLLTLDNMASRQQFLNARATFRELLAYGVVPIVNENDTVAVEQLRIGNNDSLAAQVSILCQADWLFLLTDVDALYTSDPTTDPSAQPIRIVEDPSSLQVDTSSGGTQWGTGGMATKLTAAQHATAAGTKMVICLSDPENVSRILGGERIGTVFLPAHVPVQGRKRWILNLPAKGKVTLDPGAVLAVRDHGSSLFPSGITGVEGEFGHHDSVVLCDAMGREFGRGLANYRSVELAKIKGLSSRGAEAALGYAGAEESIHRANICLLPRRGRALGSECSSVAASAANSDEETDVATESAAEYSPAEPLSRSTTPGPKTSNSDFWTLLADEKAAADKEKCAVMMANGS